MLEFTQQWHSYLSRHNLLIDLNRLICKEWRVASCHFVDENTEGPPVHGFVIALKNSRQVRLWVMLHPSQTKPTKNMMWGSYSLLWQTCFTLCINILINSNFTTMQSTKIFHKLASDISITYVVKINKMIQFLLQLLSFKVTIWLTHFLAT